MRETQVKEADLRLKKCNLCHKTVKMHKFDCFCDACRGTSNNIKRKNSGIFR